MCRGVGTDLCSSHVALGQGHTRNRVQERVYSVGSGATGIVLGRGGGSREHLAVPEQANCAGSVHLHPGRSRGDSGSGRTHGCCGRYGRRDWAVPGTHLCLGKKGKSSELCQGYRKHLAWVGQGMEGA